MLAETTAEAERILVDPDLDERLGREGIVMVPMAEPDELEAIEAAYWSLVPADEGGIVLDYLRDDRELVRVLADLMAPVWARAVPDVFERHHPVYTSFVVKHPGEDSSLFLHRDLAVDDERSHRTLSMWMPLVDTGPTLDNGPLAFVRGSEAIGHGGFGPNAVGLFSPYEAHLESLLEPFTVPAGSTLVYDARMLHASAPNRTARARVAVGCLLAPRDRPVVQVVATGRRHRVLHAVDRDYFIDHAPAGIAEDGMPARFPVVDEYDEEPATTAAGVLGPLAEPGIRRQVIVPQDLEAVAGARRPLAVVDGPRPGHDHDLAITASDLPTAGPTAAGRVAVTDNGRVGALDLVQGRRRRHDLPAAVPDAVVALDPRHTRDATLVVVDAKGRLTLRAGARRLHRHEVVVVECPAVRAGAATADHVAELDLGRRVGLTPDEPLHLWNEGPGPLVLVVRSTPTLSSGAARAR